MTTHSQEEVAPHRVGGDAQFTAEPGERPAGIVELTGLIYLGGRQSTLPWLESGALKHSSYRMPVYP